MKIINCRRCGEKFDLYSKAKKDAGGLSIHCSDCSEESSIKPIGLTSGDGKMSGVTILKFKNSKDRNIYLKFWQNNTGLHKGKSCQLGSHLSTTPFAEFEILQAPGPMNHKGKL